MVMEYLEGEDLGVLLRKQRRLASGFAVDLMLQACEALAEAHALGIVHRDIKPANFFIVQGPDGAPFLKLLDFGVSKAPRPAYDVVTHSGALIGTPPYMSPEQMQSSKYVDSRTDVWALGVVLYQLVSGRRPFRGESLPALVMMVTTQPMPPLDDIALPDGLKEVIARCLEKDPARRFQTTAELAMALAPYAATPMQATRSTERATRALALAALPLVGSPIRSEAAESTYRVDSTMRESAGEQVSLSSTQPAGATTYVPATTPSPHAVLPPTVNLRESRRRSPRAMVVAAVPLLGAAVAMALVLGRRADGFGVPERGNHVVVPSTPDPVGTNASQIAAQSGSSSIDAGVVPDTSGTSGDNGPDTMEESIVLAQRQPKDGSTNATAEASRERRASSPGHRQRRKVNDTGAVQQMNKTDAKPGPRNGGSQEGSDAFPTRK